MKQTLIETNVKWKQSYLPLLIAAISAINSFMTEAVII